MTLPRRTSVPWVPLIVGGIGLAALILYVAQCEGIHP